MTPSTIEIEMCELNHKKDTSSRSTIPSPPKRSVFTDVGGQRYRKVNKNTFQKHILTWIWPVEPWSTLKHVQFNVSSGLRVVC